MSPWRAVPQHEVAFHTLAKASQKRRKAWSAVLYFFSLIRKHRPVQIKLLALQHPHRPLLLLQKLSVFAASKPWRKPRPPRPQMTPTGSHNTHVDGFPPKTTSGWSISRWSCNNWDLKSQRCSSLQASNWAEWKQSLCESSRISYTAFIKRPNLTSSALSLTSRHFQKTDNTLICLLSA